MVWWIEQQVWFERETRSARYSLSEILTERDTHSARYSLSGILTQRDTHSARGTGGTHLAAGGGRCLVSRRAHPASALRGQDARHRGRTRRPPPALAARAGDRPQAGGGPTGEPQQADQRPGRPGDAGRARPERRAAGRTRAQRRAARGPRRPGGRGLHGGALRGARRGLAGG